MAHNLRSPMEMALPSDGDTPETTSGTFELLRVGHPEIVAPFDATGTLIVTCDSGKSKANAGVSRDFVLQHPKLVKTEAFRKQNFALWEKKKIPSSVIREKSESWSEAALEKVMEQVIAQTEDTDAEIESNPLMTIPWVRRANKKEKNLQQTKFSPDCSNALIDYAAASQMMLAGE